MSYQFVQEKNLSKKKVWLKSKHSDFTSLQSEWLSSTTHTAANVCEDAGEKGTLIHLVRNQCRLCAV
jgi:uncharacterized membrane-anchored protein YjiN (DUF445 family)